MVVGMGVRVTRVWMGLGMPSIWVVRPKMPSGWLLGLLHRIDRVLGFQNVIISHFMITIF